MSLEPPQEIKQWQKMSLKDLEALSPEQHMRAIEWYTLQNTRQSILDDCRRQVRDEMEQERERMYEGLRAELQRNVAKAIWEEMSQMPSGSPDRSFNKSRDRKISSTLYKPTIGSMMKDQLIPNKTKISIESLQARREGPDDTERTEVTTSWQQVVNSANTGTPIRPKTKSKKVASKLPKMATAVRSANKLANARVYGATRQTLMSSDHSPVNEGGSQVGSIAMHSYRAESPKSRNTEQVKTQREKSPLHQMRDRFTAKLQEQVATRRDERGLMSPKAAKGKSMGPQAQARAAARVTSANALAAKGREKASGRVSPGRLGRKNVETPTKQRYAMPDNFKRMSPQQKEIADFEEIEKAVGASPKDSNNSFSKFFKNRSLNQDLFTENRIQG